MATTDIFSGAEAQERLNQLPPEIRNLIYSAEMTSIIRKIGSAHGLHIDQIGNLEAETSFLMLGFTDQKDFAHVLAQRLPVEESLGQQLALDVHDQLLVKIRTALHKLYPDSVDPVSGKPTPTTEHPRTATTPAAVQKQEPASAPVVVHSPLSLKPLNPIDAALQSTQHTPTKTSVIERPPAVKRTSYASDPYLEPIE